MRVLFGFLASSWVLFAAVEGVVTNATSGKPQASAIVSLLQPGSGGMQTLASTKADAEGKFRIDKDIPPGPALVQALYQGTTYNVILTPGTPTTGVHLNVYDSTAKAGTARVSQHMVVVEPGAAALRISETLLMKNDTKLTYQDPAKGSARFYIPASVTDRVQVTVDAPGGMPIQRPAEKTSQAGVYKVSYPLKPGETRFDISYNLAASDTFAGRNLHPEDPARLVTAGSVTLSGDHVESMGQEPQTQARIYSVSGPTYEVKIEGTGTIRTPEGNAQEEDNGSPPLVEAPARLYTQAGWVLGLTLGILALGGALLYRRGAA